MVHLVPIPVLGHDILKRIGLGIYRSDECSVESFSRLGINAGASSKSQQADTRDHEEESEAGIGIARYSIFHISRYHPNDGPVYSKAMIGYQIY
jgi:hypothetical protein